MLSVILTILKIIGIILLVILGLLLTVALVVMFVPIRYKSNGSFKKLDEGLEDDITVRFTWLLHILSVSFNLKDKETKLVIKIFGKRLTLGNKKSSKKASVKKKNDIPNKAPTNNTTEIKVQKVDKPKIEKEIKTQIEEKPKEKKSIKQKFSNIWQKINSICQKIKNVKDIKDSFVEYLKKEESRVAIREIKNIILKTFKKLLPRKLSARLRFGFEDPSTTGNVLGIASIFYGIYGDKLELEPDFEHTVLEGQYKLSGKVRVITIVIAALKIYKNKWLKKFIAFSKKTVKNI